MASGFSLKDQLFNAQKVSYLAGLFTAVDSGFDSAGFQTRVVEKFPELELKERITHIAAVLDNYLPDDFEAAAALVSRALPPPLDPTKTDDDFGDFIFAPLGEWVVLRGLHTHPDRALEMLGVITQRFSMEWAVRPFLNQWPDQTLQQMAVWVDHPSYHVRRLVSEGTRPRLPWGEGVALEMTQPLPLLDQLHVDPTRFVTRSVANHLNDISKKDPDLVLDRLQAWQMQGAQTPTELDWMTRHALRGLVKSGRPRALTMVGFDPDTKIEVQDFNVPTQIAIGDALTLSATLVAPDGGGALVDYVFWRQMANGKMAPKVFKLKQVQLPPGKPVSLKKSHRLKGDATTFRLLPGAHRIELQINGKVLASRDFTLLSTGV